MSTQNTSKGLNIALWIVQVLLAGMFLMVGFMKAFTPIAELVAGGMVWAGDMPALARFIGTCQLFGAIGLLLPALLRIKPVLTAWAGTGLATCMLFAIIFHVVRGEAAHIGAPVVLFILAAFIAWGRFTKAPIQPK